MHKGMLSVADKLATQIQSAQNIHNVIPDQSENGAIDLAQEFAKELWEQRNLIQYFGTVLLGGPISLELLGIMAITYPVSLALPIFVPIIYDKLTLNEIGLVQLTELGYGNITIAYDKKLYKATVNIVLFDYPQESINMVIPFKLTPTAPPNWGSTVAVDFLEVDYAKLWIHY